MADLADGADTADLAVGAGPGQGRADRTDESAGRSESIACASCGATPVDPSDALLRWTRGLERGRVVWTCLECSRRHVRSIEGKLDSQWW